jgi:hypothetical protein
MVPSFAFLSFSGILLLKFLKKIFDLYKKYSGIFDEFFTNINYYLYLLRFQEFLRVKTPLLFVFILSYF